MEKNTRTTVLIIGTLLVAGALSFIMIFTRWFPYENQLSFSPPTANPPLATTTLFLKGIPIVAELALVPMTQTKGLSNRPSLPPGSGMLFIFDHEDTFSFWMKEMNFPIDMIWFGSDQRIVHIVHSASPESYPNLFTSPSPARFVLEVPAGFAETHAVTLGDFLTFLVDENVTETQ